MAAPLREGLVRIETALESATFMPADTERKFAIAATDHATLGWIAPLIDRMRVEAPRSGLRVRPIMTLDAAKELEFGTLDLAVGTYVEIPERFRHLDLGEDRRVWVMRPDHPLATKSELSVEDLAHTPHLSVSVSDEEPDEHGIIDQHGLKRRVVFEDEMILDQLLAERGLAMRKVVSVPYFAVVPFVLSGSDVVALLPSRAAARLSEAGTLVIREAPYDAPPLRLVAVWHAHQEDQPGHRWLRR